jgi:hypothetical protein
MNALGKLGSKLIEGSFDGFANAYSNMFAGTPLVDLLAQPLLRPMCTLRHMETEKELVT